MTACEINVDKLSAAKEVKESIFEYFHSLNYQILRFDNMDLNLMAFDTRNAIDGWYDIVCVPQQ